jgi:hypothetical protein
VAEPAHAAVGEVHARGGGSGGGSGADSHIRLPSQRGAGAAAGVIGRPAFWGEGGSVGVGGCRAIRLVMSWVTHLAMCPCSPRCLTAPLSPVDQINRLDRTPVISAILAIPIVRSLVLAVLPGACVALTCMQWECLTHTAWIYSPLAYGCGHG